MSALDKKHEELLEESQQVKKALQAKIEQLEAEQKGLMKRLTEMEVAENEKKKQLEKMKRSVKEKAEEEKALQGEKMELMKSVKLQEAVVKKLQQEKGVLLKQLKEQRVTALHWQYRVDRLLEIWLCRKCVDNKDNAYSDGLGYTWFPDCGSSNCNIIKMCLQAGLPGHDGEDEFVTPVYWDEDATLKSVEKELGLSMAISLASLDETIEKEKKEVIEAVDGERKLLHHMAKAMTNLDETPEPKPLGDGPDAEKLQLQQDKVTLLHDLRQQRTLAFHWQYRLDRLMDLRLCHQCCEEKDDAYSAGKGLAWVPNCDLVDCGNFRRVLRAGCPTTKTT